MTLTEIITTGHIPDKITFDNGIEMWLDVTVNHAGDYVACILNHDHIYCYGIGRSRKEAEENLIKKLASE